MTVPEVKRLKALEEKNAKLKEQLAGQILDLAAMKELVPKKRGDARREARGGRASEGPVRIFGTAGLPDCLCGSQDGPISVAASAGNGTARPLAGLGQ